MQQIFIGRGVRGFGRLADYAVRWTRMVTDEAKRRARIIAFLEKHGSEAAREAFAVSRRTLFRWRAALKSGGGKFESLNAKSRRPKGVRKRSWPAEYVAELRKLRAEHPNLGPDKSAILLRPFCAAGGLAAPSARTVARLIADDPDRMRTFPVKVRHDGRIVPRKRAKRARKPKGFVAERPGHCGAFDTVERFVWGARRYIVTFTDTYSRFAFAVATASHGSQAAKEVFDAVRSVFPYPLEYVLTDNGSEFMKDFDAEIRRLHMVHWHTYPRTPKMNAHAERFNRTIQEEYVDFHAAELLDTRAFNRNMVEWLLWYNGERPHWSLDLKAPIQFLTEREPEECQMWWRDTPH